LVHGRQALKGNAVSKIKQPKTIRHHDHLVESQVETEIIGYVFTVVCSVTLPMNASKAGGDLDLIQTSLLFSFK